MNVSLLPIIVWQFRESHRIKVYRNNSLNPNWPTDSIHTAAAPGITNNYHYLAILSHSVNFIIIIISPASPPRYEERFGSGSCQNNYDTWLGRCGVGWGAVSLLAVTWHGRNELKLLVGWNYSCGGWDVVIKLINSPAVVSENGLFGLLFALLSIACYYFNCSELL